MNRRHFVGWLCVVACAAGPLGAQDIQPLTVRQLKFEGNRSVPAEELAAAIATTNSSWFATSPLVRWIGLGEKRPFDEQNFRRDVLRLELYYRQSGFLEVKVDTLVRRTDRNVYITFRITEGPPVIVDTLRITGIDSVRRPERLLEDLPLKVGDPFNRYKFQALADSLVRRLRDRGYPGVEVYRSFDMDREERRAALQAEVVAGTFGRIGPIRVAPAKGVDTAQVRQLLTVRSGRPYSQSALFRSQLNLYRTELFRYASVVIDSAAYSPDSAVVPLLVNVTRGPEFRGRGGLGYATEDCFRANLGFTQRGVLGMGRVLDVTASVSKLGAAPPLDPGWTNGICSQAKADSIGSSAINYNVTVGFRRPAFLNSGNALSVSLYSERRSEYLVYLVEAFGGTVGLATDNLRRWPASVNYRLSYGRTLASEANYCATFNACTDEDIALLAQRQWLGLVTVALSRPRVNNLLNPSRGSIISLEGSVSSTAFGSSKYQTFQRLLANAAWYRTIFPGVVLAWRLRAGIIFAPQQVINDQAVTYVPPDQRLYAGGPNDVRGYKANQLGPIVYVVNDETFPIDSAEAGFLPANADVGYSPAGGNTLGVANVEVRFPSPIFSRTMRLAAFVDGGILWQREGGGLTSPAQWRTTPGVGIRLATPLGPARVDVAYNPYPLAPGPLYLSQGGALYLINKSYGGPQNSKFTFHVTVGQAF